ncbi:MAG: AIM24 family protein [Pseudomonadota bacterium]
MAKFEIKTKDLMHYVEITLNNESVRVESGAGRYWRGNINMTNPMPSVGGMLKSAITGNKIFRPVFEGTGTLMLNPRFHEFVEIELTGNKVVLERGAYWASDMGIEVDAFVNSMSAGLFSGEGFIQTAVSGVGKVIASSPGPIEIVDLKNERLVLDGAVAVARSSGLKYSVQKSSRSLIGSMASGEGFVQVIEGTGRVFLSSVPNHTVALQEVIISSILGVIAAQRK